MLMEGREKTCSCCNSLWSNLLMHIHGLIIATRASEFYSMLCFCELCRTLTADQLPHAESRGRGGGGGGGRGLVERTLSVGHVEQVGLRRCGACLTLLLDTQTNTHRAETIYWQQVVQKNIHYPLPHIITIIIIYSDHVIMVIGL